MAWLLLSLQMGKICNSRSIKHPINTSFRADVVVILSIHTAILGDREQIVFALWYERYVVQRAADKYTGPFGIV
jgi:hypothetical protein